MNNVTNHETKQQAVIVADTFNQNFQPISVDVSPVLLPIANSTCIDFTLNWLRKGFIEETFVYCKSKHLQQFQESCKHWLNRKYGMSVKLIPLENMESVGDAMRDLYSRSLINGDFILLSGNIIGNLDIRNLLSIHKNKRKLSSSVVMSGVYLSYGDWGKEHYSVSTSFTHVATGKLLTNHKPPMDLHVPKKTVDIAKKGAGGLFTRMCDPNVLICSEMLPSLFSDNFDYDSKDNLLNGILGEEDLMGYTINFIHDVDGFCLNIENFAIYEQMSIAMLQRKCVPVVCEVSPRTNRIRHKFSSKPVYYYDESACFRPESLDFALVDAATVVHPAARISHSTIGKHCEIGDKTKINCSFVQNNVKIGKNCTLSTCYIADGVTILDGVTIQQGAVIGSNVTIGPNVTVPTRTRLVVTQAADGFTKCNKQILGAKGKGFVYEPDFPEEIYNCSWGMELGIEKELNEAASEDDEEDESDHGDNSDSDDEDFTDFFNEVKDSIVNGLNENSDPENIVLEINASRHAYNVKLEDVQKIVLKLVLQAFECKDEKILCGEALWKSVKKGMHALSGVISKYVQKPKDQLIALIAIEELVSEEERYLPLIQKVLFELNQELQFLNDEIIVTWFTEYQKHTDAFPKISKLIQKYIDWLDDDDDESE